MTKIHSLASIYNQIQWNPTESNWIQLGLELIKDTLREGVQKKRVFNGQADSKGWRSAKCNIF